MSNALPNISSFLLAPLRFARRRWKLSLILLLLIAGGAWQYQRTQAAKTPTYTFTKPVRQTITKTLELSGSVDAKERAKLRFATGGKIVRLGAKEGDTVKKGQTIAVIDQRDLRKRLEKDLNSYSQERLDWDQQLDDIKDRALPKSEDRTVDKNQINLNNTVLDVEIRTIAIQNTVLSAPFAGVLVSAPTAVAGVDLLATDIFELVNPNSLVFRAFIDEADIAQLQLGQRVSIELDAYPDAPLGSFIDYIDYTSSQTTSGTGFWVEMPLQVENALDRYRLGMNGDASVTLATRTDVLTIPLIATREREDTIYVDVRTGEQTIEAREITIGLETDELIEVTSGLKETDEIVLPE